MMGAIQLGRIASPLIAAAFGSVAIISSRLIRTGEIAGIATFSNTFGRSWGAILKSSDGPTVVGHTLLPRSDLGTRNRVDGGSCVGWGAPSDEFAVNGTDCEGTGEDEGEGEACFAATLGLSISGAVSPG